MLNTKYRLGAFAVALASSVSIAAMAQAQGVIGSIAKNDSIFIDGKTFNVITGRSKGDAATDVRKLAARELGAGAIIFRSDDKLFIADASTRIPFFLADADTERQRPLGLRDDDVERQRPLGLRDADVDRQRPLGLRDTDIERQRAVGLRDADIERQRALGLRDADVERQRALGLRDADVERQRALGLRDGTYAAASDADGGRQRIYINDPEYAYYRLKKAFEEGWTTNLAK